MATATELAILITAKDDASRVFSGLQGSLSGFEQTAKRAALAAAASLTAAAGFSLKAAVDFETAFTGVKKTVNATDAEFAALSGAIRGMAKDMPSNTNSSWPPTRFAYSTGMPVSRMRAAIAAWRVGCFSM